MFQKINIYKNYNSYNIKLKILKKLIRKFKKYIQILPNIKILYVSQKIKLVKIMEALQYLIKNKVINIQNNPKYLILQLIKSMKTIIIIW